MIDIHPTAIVGKKTEIGDNVIIGPFSIVEDDVKIGSGTSIGSNVLIADGTRIGEECKIFNGAVLGSAPQDLKYKGEKTELEVGDNTVIREFCTLNRGTLDRYKTVVGNNCLLMAYVHIAHDCHIGNNVILANAVNMAGHITIEDYVGVGGMDPIHQFVKIGCHAFVGGGYRVDKDIPPYILAAGDPLTFAGLNTVGLTRRNFSRDTLATLKRVYKLIYRSKLNVTQALARIENEFESSPEIDHVVDFVRNSSRGIIK